MKIINENNKYKEKNNELINENNKYKEDNNKLINDKINLNSEINNIKGKVNLYFNLNLYS